MTASIGTLVILGADGDLTRRLLLPGVGQLLDRRTAGDGVDGHVRLLGVGQKPLTPAEWSGRITDAFVEAGASAELAGTVAVRSPYLRADATDPADLTKVLQACTGVPALYFALPPQVTAAACAALAEVELPEGTVLVMEKPFGTDLRSAQALNRQLVKLVPEHQVQRVDHFLGKSTVLNLLGLRFANRVFEQVWGRDNVERVEIVFDEQLTLEGRAGYYDAAGALEDMIQSHLLLVLALVAMEPPSSVESDDLHGAMAQALRATAVLAGDPVAASRRARYTAGRIGDRQVPAYVDEPGVEPGRGTETLAEVTLGIQNWRWAGVPFLLRSGKALGAMRKEIVVVFKEVPHLPGGLSGRQEPARLRISLSPDQIDLDLMLNGEGDPFELDRVTLSAGLGAAELGPYGEVLSGILAADPTLSVRSDVTEECWRIVSPVLEAWERDDVPLETYPAGSAGPDGWQ